MEKWVILIFVAVFLVCSFFVKRFMIRMINSAERQSAVAAINSKEDSPLDYWQESGNSRKFENADYPLPEEDFFQSWRNLTPCFHPLSTQHWVTPEP